MGDVTDHHQDFALGSFISAAPEIEFIRQHVNELEPDAHTISCLKHGSLHHGIHLELPGDVRQGFVRVFVLHHRRAGDHPLQSADLTQFANELVGHAVHEIFLLCVPGEIFQRQHGNGINSLSLLGDQNQHGCHRNKQTS